MKTAKFIEKEEDLVHLTDNVEGEVSAEEYLFLKELEEKEYEEYVKGLHSEFDRIQLDIELVEKALTDLLCQREELLKKIGR